MKIRKSDLEPQAKNNNPEILNWTKERYKAFDKAVALEKEDSLFVMGFKLFLRFLGILIMLLLSPFIILGLVVAFMAVL